MWRNQLENPKTVLIKYSPDLEAKKVPPAGILPEFSRRVLGFTPRLGGSQLNIWLTRKALSLLEDEIISRIPALAHQKQPILEDVPHHVVQVLDLFQTQVFFGTYG